ncbi:MAG TPA: FecR domain-containing protein [Verrucomicrobiae bacterium]|nr:FecR domain-containing protein [Verrucomicrobiae bacterium]
MLRIKFALAVVGFYSVFSTHQSIAGPLTSAEVTKIINRVSVIDPAKGAHPAMVRDVIKDDLGLQTGAKSRSELLFQDSSLTRIGAETFFSFKTGTRDMTLEKGSMLLQVPKGLGGAKIHTAAVTAAITGTTIMIEYSPGQYIKVLVLEGSLRLSRNGSFGDSVVLHPGKMVIMRPDAKKIPNPIDVDLAEIVRTSTLVNFPGSNILPSMALIQAAISDQAKEVAKGTLVPTNLVMGHGTKVVLASNDQLAKTVGGVGLLGASLNGGSVAGLKGGAPLQTLGSVATNVSTTGTTAVNNLLGSGTAVSISSSTQLLSLLSNAAPSSSGTITITPAAVNAGASVAVAPTGAVNVSAAVGSVSAAVNVPSTGSILPTTLTGAVPTLLGQTPVGSNPTRLVGTGSLLGPGVIGSSSGH